MISARLYRGPWWLFAGLVLWTACVPRSRFADAADLSTRDDIFRRDNLVAWCIVPFDAKKRDPVARAAMLKRLGLTRLAYDWRAEHVPSFEKEILALKKQGIDFFAFWSPASRNPGYESMMGLIKKYKLHPQIWMIAPSAKAASYQQRVATNAGALLPFVQQAKRLGCKFAVYNHEGWSGEPENMIAMVHWLRQHAHTQNVGIVYNFHHGREHLARFPQAFRPMVPYLYCVNLNGMRRGGPMILPLGQGDHDRQWLEMVRDSGYRGPIGILDHRGNVDAEQSLRENLEGLEKLLGTTPLAGKTR